MTDMFFPNCTQRFITVSHAQSMRTLSVSALVRTGGTVNLRSASGAGMTAQGQDRVHRAQVVPHLQLPLQSLLVPKFRNVFLGLVLSPMGKWTFPVLRNQCYCIPSMLNLQYNLWFDPFSLSPSIPAVKLSSDLIYVAIDRKSVV